MTIFIQTENDQVVFSIPPVGMQKDAMLVFPKWEEDVQITGCISQSIMSAWYITLDSLTAVDKDP